MPSIDWPSFTVGLVTGGGLIGLLMLFFEIHCNQENDDDDRY